MPPVKKRIMKTRIVRKAVKKPITTAPDPPQQLAPEEKNTCPPKSVEAADKSPDNTEAPPTRSIVATATAAEAPQAPAASPSQPEKLSAPDGETEGKTRPLGQADPPSVKTTAAKSASAPSKGKGSDVIAKKEQAPDTPLSDRFETAKQQVRRDNLVRADTQDQHVSATPASEKPSEPGPGTPFYGEDDDDDDGSCCPSDLTPSDLEAELEQVQQDARDELSKKRKKSDAQGETSPEVPVVKKEDGQQDPP